MSSVSIRELRNKGGEVVDRAARGEAITITKSGVPVAELRGLPVRAVNASTLLQRWKRIPSVDPDRLRQDVDAAIDQSL